MDDFTKFFISSGNMGNLNNSNEKEDYEFSNNPPFYNIIKGVLIALFFGWLWLIDWLIRTLGLFEGLLLGFSIGLVSLVLIVFLIIKIESIICKIYKEKSKERSNN